jgi:hypothetical protein
MANKSLWDEVRERRRREEARLEEDEPEETHWDKGTQTEDTISEQDLPPQKRRIQTRKNPHEVKTRMSRLELSSNNNKCTLRSVPQPCC